MKTSGIFSGNFDEVVFSGRNKEYGAYALRAHYASSLNKAFGITSGLMLLIVSIPLISSYYHRQQLISDTQWVMAEFSNLDGTTPPPPPPPLPPDDKLLEKKTRFVAPIITKNDTAIDDQALNQDDWIKKSVSQPVDSILSYGGGEELKKVIEEPKHTEPFTVVEVMPEFPGGEEGRIQFLSNHMIYPELAKASGISGTVYVEFVVEANGKVSSLQIKKGIGGGCDEEAMRVVGMMKWNPGLQAGQCVPVRFTLPIRFVLKG